MGLASMLFVLGAVLAALALRAWVRPLRRANAVLGRELDAFLATQRPQLVFRRIDAWLGLNPLFQLEGRRPLRLTPLYLAMLRRASDPAARQAMLRAFVDEVVPVETTLRAP